jgi:hypothetical protein
VCDTLVLPRAILDRGEASIADCEKIALGNVEGIEDGVDVVGVIGRSYSRWPRVGKSKAASVIAN